MGYLRILVSITGGRESVLSLVVGHASIAQDKTTFIQRESTLTLDDTTSAMYAAAFFPSLALFSAQWLLEC